MIKLKNNKIKIIVFILFLIAFLIYYIWERGNPNALWEIVNQQCVPNQIKNANPSPCLKVDLDKKYVLFKDEKGPKHDLIMPTYKVTGIESPELQKNSSPSFFSYAWDERTNLTKGDNKNIDDNRISLAVNSKYGRSQDQLHIHLSCLKKEVSVALEKDKDAISNDWKVLPSKLEGHTYLVKKLESNDLYKENPFKLLQNYISRIDDDIEYYGLAVSKLKDGSMVLLANRFDLLELNLGSAGEIQDYKCNMN
ncbi:CDP-diacylglycerol diphosphatase [Xenorhabdus koppenhoeferi]|uniref:CDP-diacylglycerol pyrophosphatase n=2 Tax=Xenorhabdus TaxID=626 RepID=A0A1I7HCT1_9GAMM|nr:CDP-diacylglycerol diphosphatase [Xenorhabdus koppenhoeferi]SFU58525.1 CDP-diacylglycerol pyrophosphatase [Xenorhabdus koppenhoeferi]